MKLEGMPYSKEELTMFRLRTGEDVFAWVLDKISETERAMWIVENKHWAVERVVLKMRHGSTLPMLVIKFTSKSICIGKVILACYRAGSYTDILFEGFGLTGSRYDIAAQLREHYQFTDEDIIVYETNK